MSTTVFSVRILTESSMLTRALSLAVSVACIAGTAHASPTHWEYEGATFEHYVADPGNSGWVEYDGIRPTVASEHLFSGLRMNGIGETDDLANNQLFALSAADYRGEADADGRGSRLILRGSAEVHEPWDSATWSIPTTFNFGFSFGSGALAVHSAQTTFLAFDHDHNFVQGVGSGFGDPGLGTFEPGGHGGAGRGDARGPAPPPVMIGERSRRPFRSAALRIRV